MPRCTGSVTRPGPIESRGQAASNGGPRPFAGRWDDVRSWFLLGRGQWLGTRGGDSCDNGGVSIEELTLALQAVSVGKAAGIDEVPPEFYKALRGDPDSLQALLEISTMLG